MKNIKTIIIIIIVAALGYFVYTKVTANKSSLSKEALSNFAIKDTASIDMIKLSDTEGKGMSFEKNNNIWTLDDGKCVQQHMILTFLETFKYVSVKAPTPVGTINNVNKRMISTHKKIEIYQNGKLSKTWYIGSSTQDHLGTYMLLKDPIKGKSPEPYIMFLPNQHGTLNERFSTNPLDYVCSEIFKYDPITISEIDVRIPDSTHLNYKIVVIDKNLFELYNNDTKIEHFDTSEVRKYLLGYQKVHFEYLNRTASPEKSDSLKNSQPFYTIAVSSSSNDVNKIICHLKNPGFDRYDFDGNLMDFDKDRLWVFTKDEELTICQYHVFDKLLRDINFFKLKE